MHQQLHKFSIVDDSGMMMTLKAEDADHAARLYAKVRRWPDIRTVDDVRRCIESAGGYGYMTDEAGVEIWRINPTGRL